MSAIETELVPWMRNIQSARYAIVAANFVQICEWLAMSRMEAKFVSRGRWTFAKFAYILCRYYPLAIWPFETWVNVGDHTEALCHRVLRPSQALLAPFQIFPQGVMLMRAYAFSGRKMEILIGLSLCYASLIAVNVWVFTWNIQLAPSVFYILVGPSGCFMDYRVGGMDLRMGFSILAATLMDFISLVVVLIHCHRTRGRDISLGRFFVNQGLASFGLLFLVNVVAAIHFFQPGPRRSGIGLPFYLVLPSVIACRLILQLRERNSPSATELYRRNSRIVQRELGWSAESTELLEVKTPTSPNTPLSLLSPITLLSPKSPLSP